MKFLRRQPRFLIALAVGVTGFFLLPSGWSFVIRTLVSWDLGVAIFLIAIYLWIRNLTAERIRSHYIEEDPSGPIILVAVTAASLLSLVATVELLATLRHVEHSERIWHFTLAAMTLIGSWMLVPTMFTMHYADMFYSARPQDRPLSFPQTEMPIFFDFAYFSFTIAAACQTADVLTTRLSIRKVVIAHEIISFAFNASILGFAINVFAGLVGGN
ncbi:MAG TPA: DUF1345 domain-containing protein [Steroidobacteraceae bacterium]|jgi:uncharacterized membrane protein|nr:DUF1345 domain-containing protein [Steroidobacteraceae bacterium]